MQASKLSRVLPAGMAPNQRFSSAVHYSKHSSRLKGQLMRALLEEKQFEERKNTLLGAQKQYPFPGNVTCASHIHQLFEEAEGAATPATTLPSTPPPTNSNTYSVQIGKLLDGLLNHPVRRAEKHPPPAYTDSSSTNCVRRVDIKAMPCPKLLIIGMRKVFGGVDLSAKEMTVINLTQKVVGSAGEGASMVEGGGGGGEEEQLQLSYTFVEAASAICQSLHFCGHWADFIDPRSGKAHYTGTVGSKPFDFDHRYHRLGFSIDELGSCDIISSVNWSDSQFVGTIFTDAPHDCQIVKQIMREVNREEAGEGEASEGDEGSPTDSSRHEEGL